MLQLTNKTVVPAEPAPAGIAEGLPEPAEAKEGNPYTSLGRLDTGNLPTGMTMLLNHLYNHETECFNQRLEKVNPFVLILSKDEWIYVRPNDKLQSNRPGSWLLSSCGSNL
ncbi:MAG: hypothetical protein ACRER2_00515 [Methylococcales bacterium]